jgi:hypothetical protein
MSQNVVLQLSHCNLKIQKSQNFRVKFALSGKSKEALIAAQMKTLTIYMRESSML